MHKSNQQTDIDYTLDYDLGEISNLLLNYGMTT